MTMIFVRKIAMILGKQGEKRIEVLKTGRKEDYGKKGKVIWILLSSHFKWKWIYISLNNVQKQAKVPGL